MRYCFIQLIKYDGTWSNPIWDSGKTSFTSSVLEGNRTEDIIKNRKTPGFSRGDLKSFERSFGARIFA